MTYLKEKSDNNVKSAQSLINQSLYSSSVHCSYYSCVQLMLHILRSDLSKTEAQIEREQRGQSFHNWLINLIKLEFDGRDPSQSRTFYSTIGQLKALRVKADYKNIEILPNEANRALTNANTMLMSLKNNFII